MPLIYRRSAELRLLPNAVAGPNGFTRVVCPRFLRQTFHESAAHSIGFCEWARSSASRTRNRWRKSATGSDVRSAATTNTMRFRGNSATLGRFRHRLFWLWWKIVGRRSERRMRWERYCSMFDRWVPLSSHRASLPACSLRRHASRIGAICASNARTDLRRGRLERPTQPPEWVKLRKFFKMFCAMLILFTFR